VIPILPSAEMPARRHGESPGGITARKGRTHMATALEINTVDKLGEVIWVRSLSP
jgi:hypothetical protein